MNMPLYLALRFFRSHKNKGFASFITVIAALGVALGVAALIITLSILDGFERTISRNIVNFAAHIQVIGFQNQYLPAPQMSAKRLREMSPLIERVAPYVSGEAMIAVGRRTEGVMVKGIDPANDISPASTRLVSGMNLNSRASTVNEIIVGKRFAQKLNAQLGDEVLLFSPDAAGNGLHQSKIVGARIAGIYETGMGEFDETIIYTSLNVARRLFGAGDAVSGFELLLSDIDSISSLASIIPAHMGYPFYARTMYQNYRNLFAWVELQKKPIPIILSLISLVATVNIIGTLLMIILEKSSQVGILRAVGARRKIITRTFLYQGMVIGIIGTALGSIVAVTLLVIESHYRFFSLPAGVYYMTHLPIHLSAWSFLIVVGVSLTMCFLTSWIPARIAASIDPIRILRFA